MSKNLSLIMGTGRFTIHLDLEGFEQKHRPTSPHARNFMTIKRQGAYFYCRSPAFGKLVNF
jgi:hypothetical protein